MKYSFEIVHSVKFKQTTFVCEVRNIQICFSHRFGNIIVALDRGMSRNKMNGDVTNKT